MQEQNPDHLHPRAVAGIQLFNQKKFFEAHEELEAAWKEEKGQIRELYRGILQVGVAYYHIQKKNYAGGKIMLERSIKWLDLFPNEILGINNYKLKQDSQFVYKTLVQMGEEAIDRFNPILFYPVDFQSSGK
jgi:predicted metal-dependent hydrolase